MLKLNGKSVGGVASDASAVNYGDTTVEEKLNKMTNDIDSLNSTMNGSLTSQGLVADKCSIVNGGYCKIGKLVIVNIRISNTSESAYRRITGFPTYSGQSRVALSGYDYVSSQSHEVTLLANGTLTSLNTSSNGSFISGCYICN